MRRVLLLMLLVPAACFAADVFSGVWKIDIARCTSSIHALPAKTMVQTLALRPDGLTVTEDLTAANAKKTHRENTIKFDGKDYPRTGINTPGITLSAKRVDDRTLLFVRKRDGKPDGESRWTVSADGKTLTDTGWANSPTGERNEYKSIFVK